jgi:DNA methyltransferase 1-associated protein 1
MYHQREFRTFKNGARSDGFELRHWVKASTEPSAGTYYLGAFLTMFLRLCLEYPFIKYNVQPTTYTYSQDEYARFLEGKFIVSMWLYVVLAHVFHKDNEWTKEETDYLFKVVGEYDLRWYIIHDRYDYPGGVPRTLEVTLFRSLRMDYFG